MIRTFLGRVRRYSLRALHILRRDHEVVNDGKNTRIYNYKASMGLFAKPQKRAVFAYITEPVIAELRGHRPLKFSNEGLAVEITHLLNQLGYVVDVVSWEDQGFIPQRNYDLAILNGPKTEEFLKKLKASDTTIVYFSTGSYWAFHNMAEEDRFESFKKRHNKILPLDRHIHRSEEDANMAADAIIALGNDTVASTYRKFEHVYNLNIGMYPNPRKNIISRDWEHARNNFLFLSGGGNVHKGLDVLLDAFAGSDKHLYIASMLDKEFEEFYKKELYESPNIHYLGFVQQRSDIFYKTMNECGFIILPSCSEGSPGAVVDCMQYGLIPVVTPQAGLDIGEAGIEIKSIEVSDMTKLIAELSLTALPQLKKKSAAARKSALSEYSAARFSQNFTEILQKIESNKSPHEHGDI